MIASVYWYSAISYSNGRHLARTSDGKLYAVYTTTDASGSIHVFVRESSDGGDNWSSATQLSTTAGAYQAVIAADSRDDLHVVFYGLGAGSYNQLWHVWRREGVWQAPVRVSTAAGMDSYHQYTPALCVDAADDLQLVWYGKATGYTSYDQIWWAACQQGVWQTPVRLSTYPGMDGYGQSYPTIAADGEFGLHVAWVGKATGYTGYNQIWYAQYLNGAWQSPALISTYSGMDSYDQGVPSLAVDRAGLVHVVWYGKATGYTSYNQVWYAKRTDSWQTPVRISTGTGMDAKTQQWPTIAVDTAGQLHAIWEGADSTYTGRNVFYVKYDGSSWGTPAAKTTAGYNQRTCCRWAPFHNREGSLDWIWLEGTAFSFGSGGDSDQSITQGNPKSQSFKALESKRLSRVGLYLKNPGGPAGATVEIYAADGEGKPTGSSLGSASSTVPSSSYSWIYFNFWDQTIDLTADSSYCIVLHSVDSPAAGLHWYVDASSPSYADGNWAYYSGGSWIADTGKDGYFYIYPFYDIEFGRDTAVTPDDCATMSATNYHYDAAGRQLAIRDALGKLTTSVYDAAGRRTALVDARGNRTTFSYDSASRLTAEVDALSQACSYGYDAAGRRSWRLDPKGQRTTYVYDAANRQTRLEYSDGKRVTYSYDNAGNRTTMADSTGTTTYSYDSLNRLAAVVTPGPRTISYDFDAAGNRSLLVDPDAGRTTYSYDGRRLLSSLVNAYGERTTWQYDVAGRPTTMTHGNASIAETDYDAAGRIASVRNLKSDRSVLSVFNYSYDAGGNRTGVQEANGDRVTWSYDATNQLARERRSGTNAYDVTFTYDAAGSRLTRLEGGTTTTYSYDAANQLNTEVTPSQRTTYSYDANGNTQVINAAGQLTTYSWDIEDHITGVQLPAGSRNTFSYDGDGRRRRMEESASARDLLWDGENVLREQDGASLVAQYTHAPERYGLLVSQRRGNATSYHHFDALGSTERLTDSFQAALISYLYRAFGEQTTLSGSHANPLTWVGRLGYYRQADSADYWLRARVYRPTVGRFVSRDPVRQANLYLWPGNSPVVIADPTGRNGRRSLPSGVWDMRNVPTTPDGQPAPGYGNAPNQRPVGINARECRPGQSQTEGTPIVTLGESEQQKPADWTKHYWGGFQSESGGPWEVCVHCGGDDPYMCCTPSAFGMPESLLVYSKGRWWRITKRVEVDRVQCQCGHPYGGGDRCSVRMVMVITVTDVSRGAEVSSDTVMDKKRQGRCRHTGEWAECFP